MLTIIEALQLALRHHEVGQLAEAESIYRQVLAFDPDQPDALHLLGAIAHQMGHHDSAIDLIGHAARVNPENPHYHNNLGVSLAESGRLDEAAECYRRAIQLKPDLAEAHNNLGNVCRDQARIPEAIACYHQAVGLRPDYVTPHSNAVFARHYVPDYTSEQIYQEHLVWQKRHAEPLRSTIRPHGNSADPERRLRLGYVSGDLRAHPVGQFLLPLLEHHDRERFEIFCYSHIAHPDDLTHALAKHAHHWRDIVAIDDTQAAELIRSDQIDILVDLGAQTSKRILIFAQKPAPVQVTYLAYPSTTGLDTIDYRISDPYLDPPDREERFYFEKTVRLPESYWCYQPWIETPAIQPLPATVNGYITFGSLNNFCKTTPPTLAAWRRIMRSIPESRLLLYAYPGSHRQGIRDFMAEEGVGPDRIDFISRIPQIEYFQAYQRIDIGLDPFPYPGGTTTCDALWMGVPVITLIGQPALSRGGFSLLSNVGLPDLVASSVDEYVRIATELASNLPKLSEMRAGLRAKMQASPLMDVPRFAKNMEDAYRTVWRKWCEQQISR